MAPIILNIVIHETKLQKMLAFDTKVISYLMMFKTKIILVCSWNLGKDYILLFSLDEI